MANSTQDIFAQLGFSGRDTQHILVTVFPYMFENDGALVEGWKAYAGMGNGDLNTCVPVDYIFATADPEWEFAEFELGGKSRSGLALYPDDGDYSVEFGDVERRSIILRDACEKLYIHRYQLVLKHKPTGAFAVCDPGSNNEGGPGGD